MEAALSPSPALTRPLAGTSAVRLGSGAAAFLAVLAVWRAGGAAAPFFLSTILLQMHYLQGGLGAAKSWKRGAGVSVAALATAAALYFLLALAAREALLGLSTRTPELLLHAVYFQLFAFHFWTNETTLLRWLPAASQGRPPIAWNAALGALFLGYAAIGLVQREEILRAAFPPAFLGVVALAGITCWWRALRAQKEILKSLAPLLVFQVTLFALLPFYVASSLILLYHVFLWHVMAWRRATYKEETTEPSARRSFLLENAAVAVLVGALAWLVWRPESAGALLPLAAFFCGTFALDAHGISHLVTGLLPNPARRP